METSIRTGLEHVFDIRIDFDKRWVFPLATGSSQGFVSVAGGSIEGPRLNGLVVPQGGADWATVRADGVLELNAHYMLTADDGTKIYIANTGYIVPGEKKSDGSPGQPSYFRCTPRFRCEKGPHDWLMRTIFVGTGERFTNPDYSIFRYYAMT